MIKWTIKYQNLDDRTTGEIHAQSFQPPEFEITTYMAKYRCQREEAIYNIQYGKVYWEAVASLNNAGISNHKILSCS